MSGDAARNLEERRRGQLVQVHPLPGEDWLTTLVRALAVNQALLFGDLLRERDERRRP